MDDITPYKSRLAEYLTAKGVKRDNKNYQCVSGTHADTKPSMTFFEVRHNGTGNFVKCNACGFSGDIFDIAGALIGSQNLPDQIAEVKSALGELSPAPIATVKKKSEPATWMPLSYDDAKRVYTDATVLKLANMICNRDGNKTLKIVEYYPYYNEYKQIEIMVVRFEAVADGKPSKEVLTFFWDGKRIKSKGYPVLLYNRDKLAAEPDKPVIIHEGEKCCTTAEKKLPEYVHTTWNGGCKKVKNIQGLEILKGRKCYLMPDDDNPGDSAMDEILNRITLMEKT